MRCFVDVFSRRFLRAGVLIFMMIALALSAQAATFSKASLKGSYGFLINRWTANGNTNQFAVVGVMTFDGAGNAVSYTHLYVRPQPRFPPATLQE